MSIVICDIDNCISDDRHRRHHIGAGTLTEGRDPYETYNSLCGEDEPCDPNIARVMRTANKHDAELVFITGRPEAQRKATTTWLRKHACQAHPIVFMRPDNCKLPSPALKVMLVGKALSSMNATIAAVVAAFDDREDVLEVYRGMGLAGVTLMSIDDNLSKPAPERHELEDGCAARNPADVLQGMADTFRERNKVYGDNYKRVGAVMEAMFPDGIQLNTAAGYNKWHLFELMVVKMTRFANSGLKHQDSIHDLAVYAAMVEFLTEEKEDD